MKKQNLDSEIEVNEITKAINAIGSSSLDTQTKELVLKILHAFGSILKLIQKKETTIQRLRNWIFKKTESSKNLLKTKTDLEAGTKKDAKDSESKEEKAPAEKKEKIKGHGRKAHSEYSISNEVYCSHNLKSGDSCPQCQKGKVYPHEPGIFIQLVAQPLINATKYITEKFRCNLCLAIFEASLPKSILPEKYDPSVGVALSVLRFGFAFPSYRIEQLLKAHGIPFSDSQMGVLTEEVAKAVGAPVYDALIKRISNERQVAIDDSTARIQSLSLENKTKSKSERKGVFTTAVTGLIDGHPCSLFFTGRNHAGEVLEYLLSKRTSPLPLFVMNDGASKNQTDNKLVIESNCNVHSRRNFSDINDSFPTEVQEVVEAYKIIYKNEDQCFQQNMSDQERLEFHKSKSLPVMAAMKLSFQNKLDNKLTEENSELGKAIKYFLKRYEKLIGFCKYPGVLIDNNECERAIKKFVNYRKNSFHYKTEKGAWIGERLMSLIHTAISNKVSPIEYLSSLMKNIEKVSTYPQKWFPWNYHLNLTSPTSS